MCVVFILFECYILYGCELRIHQGVFLYSTYKHVTIISLIMTKHKCATDLDLHSVLVISVVILNTQPPLHV